jgi:hypothetical protein
MSARQPCRQLIGHTKLFVESPSTVAVKVHTIVRRGRIGTARPVMLPLLVGGSPSEIRALAQKVLTVFAIDDSGSMYGSFGDPTGIRYAAAQSLVAMQRRSGGGLAGVVHWGTSCPEDLVTPLVDVRRNRHRLDRGLQIPETLGGNDMPAALRRVAEMLPRLGRHDIPLTFVITDGIESVSAETHAAVRALPKGSVHMLLVDCSNGCSEEMEQAWRTVDFGSFTRLPHFDTKAMAIALATVYAQSLGLSLDSTPTTPRRRK